MRDNTSFPTNCFLNAILDVTSGLSFCSVSHLHAILATHFPIFCVQLFSILWLWHHISFLHCCWPPFCSIHSSSCLLCQSFIVSHHTSGRSQKTGLQSLLMHTKTGLSQRSHISGNRTLRILCAMSHTFPEHPVIIRHIIPISYLISFPHVVFCSHFLSLSWCPVSSFGSISLFHCAFNLHFTNIYHIDSLSHFVHLITFHCTIHSHFNCFHVLWVCSQLSHIPTQHIILFAIPHLLRAHQPTLSWA